MKRLSILAMTAAAACSQLAPDQSKAVSDLDARVTDLEARVETMDDAAPADAREEPVGYDLMLNWPRSNAVQRTHFVSKAACQQALTEIEAQVRKSAESGRALVGTDVDGGRIVSVSPANLPDGICVKSG